MKRELLRDFHQLPGLHPDNCRCPDEGFHAHGISNFQQNPAFGRTAIGLGGFGNGKASLFPGFANVLADFLVKFLAVHIAIVNGFYKPHLASKYYLGRLFWVKMTLLIFEMYG